MAIGRLGDLGRSIERLQGILAGITADGRINLLELEHLREWFGMHEELADIEPFFGLSMAVDRILEDGKVDEGEEAEFLSLCLGFVESFGEAVSDGVGEVRFLHSFLEGITCDQTLNVEELEALQKWAQGRRDAGGLWLFDDLLEMVDRILEDRRIDPHELNELLRYCRDFMVFTG